MKTKNKRNYLKQSGITLIALVVTIVVLLILTGVSINAIFGQDGIIQKAKDAQNKMDEATQNDANSISDLDKLISSLTDKTKEGEVPDELERYFLGEDKKGKLIEEMIKEDEEDIVFIGNDIIPDAETSIKFKYIENKTESLNVRIKYKDNYYIVTVDPETIMTKMVKVAATMAMFDTGENVRKKIDNIIPEGIIQLPFLGDYNVSVDAIKKYSGVPDSDKTTEANIVSIEASDFPIYMWFEKSGKTEKRTVLTLDECAKEVEIGTIYWWSKSDDIYFNSDSSKMFAMLPYMSNINGLENIKTDYVENISFMFMSNGGTLLSNIDVLSSWNTSNVTDMHYIFYGGGLTNIDALENWDTSKVKNMRGMFAGNYRLVNIDVLKNWNTSNVTDMSCMFGELDAAGGCGFTDVSAISNWDVSKVTNMNSMFWYCGLEDISIISKWNQTTIQSQMFSGCYNLKNITIPSTVTGIEAEAFWECSNLTQVKILATDANRFEVGSSAFSNLSSNSKIYVLSEEIKAKLEGSYDTSKTTVEVVTLEQMNNL